MKTLFELFRRFDARRIFGFIRRLGGMSRPKVKCYDLRSTHALRVEDDDKDTETHTSTHTFLSTPSGWRAIPLFSVEDRLRMHFYPRPPGGGRPLSLRVDERGLWDFYPRPPGGGRRHRGLLRYTARRFLSTPSGWRATSSTFRQYFSRCPNFYPRPPGGGRRRTPKRCRASMPFLSTPSGWRAT